MTEGQAESRQVRRARERQEQKSGIAVQRRIDYIIDQGRKPKAPKKVVNTVPNPTAHPQRHPKHEDTDKGQVYGGECNITACSNRRAVYWNMGTYGLYCPSCAHAINYRRDRPPLCVHVAKKPELAEMEQFKRDNGYYEAIA